MIEIRVTTQAEADALIGAQDSGKLDLAGLDYRIARWNGQRWATIAGASRNNVTHFAGSAGHFATGGCGGGGESVNIAEPQG